MELKDIVFNTPVTNYSFVGRAGDLMQDIEQVFSLYYDQLTEDEDEKPE